MRVVNHRGRWRTVAADGAFLETFTTEQEAKEAAGLIDPVEEIIDAEEEIEEKDSEEETYTYEQKTVFSGKSKYKKKI